MELSPTVLLEDSGMAGCSRDTDLQQLITLSVWNSLDCCALLLCSLCLACVCNFLCFVDLFFLLMEDPGYTVSQVIFSPFYLELSLAERGYEQLYRWATRGEWRYKASKQVLATCSSVKMPLQQISVVPARETASNGRSSMGTNKEKSKEVEVRGRFQFAGAGWVCLWQAVGLAVERLGMQL